MDQKPVTVTLFADQLGDNQECDFAYITPISSPACRVIVTMSEIINDLVSAQCPVSLQYHHQYDQGPQLLPGGQNRIMMMISGYLMNKNVLLSDIRTYICTACKYISLSHPRNKCEE